jgi:hypothetical protein
MIKNIFIVLCVCLLILAFHIVWKKVPVEVGVGVGVEAFDGSRVYDLTELSDDFLQFDETKKYLKKPISSTCFKPYQPFRQLLNPENKMMPQLYFTDVNRSDSRIINVDTFQKEVLDTITAKYNTDSLDAKEYEEVNDPKFSIYNNIEYAAVDQATLDTITASLKSTLDTSFYAYVATLSADAADIKCPEPSVDCETHLINPGIIQIKHDDEFYLYTLQFTYYIKRKAYAYVLIAEIYYSKTGGDVVLKYLKLMGLEQEQNITIHPGYTKSQVENRVNIYRKYPYAPYETAYNYYRTSDEDNLIKLDDSEIQEQLDTRTELHAEYDNPPACVTADGTVLNYTTKEQCEATVDEYGNTKEAGVFEQACEVDTDCPFYQKNLNYTNTQGGCVNGYCELPVNVASLSYRTFDEEPEAYKPFCHNCPDENPDCCDIQQEIIDGTATGSTIAAYGYQDVTFASPDYAFVDDFDKRLTQQTQLNERNLEVN